MDNSSSSSDVNPLALLPKVPALDNTFGAVLLGTFLALALHGLTLHQSYRYFRMYPGDPRILKGSVIVVIVLETITSAMSMHLCYYYLVTNYFDPLMLLHGVWSLNLFPVASGVVMTATQSFFARRVYVLGCRYRILVAVAIVLCIVEVGFFTAASTEAFIIPTFEGFKHVTWLVSTGSTMAVTADILLTSALILVLRRSRTGVKRTDSMLEVMIMYAINTGLLTGVFNLASLLFAFIRPGDLIYIGIGIPASKLYANTLIAALNSRRSLAAKCSGPILDSSPFGFSIHPGSEQTIDANRMISPWRLKVHVRHSVTIDPTTTTDSMVLELTKTCHSSLARDASSEQIDKDLESQVEK